MTVERPTLYLMVGYPGSGKTTTSIALQKLTGATHIWADRERRAMFTHPTHSRSESHQLYGELNKRADELLSEGRSVIFDTNFNYRRDRDHLRRIAESRGAACKLIWIKVEKDIARRRATADSASQITRVLGDIPLSDFERMTGNLQPPDPDEDPIILDGTKISPAYIAEKLGLA